VGGKDTCQGLVVGITCEKELREYVRFRFECFFIVFLSQRDDTIYHLVHVLDAFFEFP